MVSKFGIGTYRLQATDEGYARAIHLSLDAGIETIDTAPTFGNGQSETALGQILTNVARSVEVFTKCGIVGASQAADLDHVSAAASRRLHVHTVAPGIQYCLEPEYLEYSLSASLHRLNCKHVHVLFVQNPELLCSPSTGGEHHQSPGYIEETLGAVFQWMESVRRRGLIQYYGISSNTCTYPADSPERISVASVWDVAQRTVGRVNGFRYVQIPFNVIEHQAATEQTEHGLSILEFAKVHSLHVVVNRVLNAIVGTDVIRLATFHDGSIVSPSDIERRIHAIEEAEHSLTQEHLAQGRAPEHVIRAAFSIGGALCTAWNQFDGIVAYQEAREQHLEPRIRHLYALGERAHAETMQRLLSDLAAMYAAEENESLSGLRTMLAEQLELPTDTPLQQLAIHAVHCTDGIGTILVGMRRTQYVRDVVAVQQLQRMKWQRNNWLQIHQKLVELSS